MFNCKAISFNRMQICLAKSNHTIETNGEKNLLLSLDIRLRATHTQICRIKFYRFNSQMEENHLCL